jgi:hypothetical protein
MVTQERLKELLHYNPDTGVFTRRVSVARGGKAGDTVGTVQKKGYVVIKIDGKVYYAHRLAWLYMTGEWPANEIDHKNLDKSFNAWGNLREATSSQNAANRLGWSATGFKGVAKSGSGYRAEIQVNGKRRNLGSFRTPEEAHAAYVEAANNNFGKFARAS